MDRGEWIKRLRAIWAFALLIAVCASAPVLAETPEAPEAPAAESPQAAAEREASEYAYVDLTPAQEEDLLREHFAPQLEAIAADPARVLDDVVINRIDSPTDALVTWKGGKALLESEVPLRAPEEDGDLHKVELELEATPGGFEPANPLVDLTLPERADEPIEVGDQGLKITPLGAADTPASPLGEEDLFLPAAREDTSFLLSPIAGGLELSALLTSRNSPEQLAFSVGLPPGATLRADGAGGAEAIDAQGGRIAAITAPYAIDAQGGEVPVTLSVDGSTMTLSVPHRDLDVAYPLFVDPEVIQEDFADAGRFGLWKWSWSGVGPEDFIGRTSCIVTCWSNVGLYVRARSNFTYPAGGWGRFWFTPQGSTTFMRRVVLGPINYDTHGCWANEPHAYVGVWNDYSGWSVLANAYPTGWGSYVDTGSQSLGPGTRTVFAGMHSNTTTSLNCGRDYRLGGATLFLDDPENPTAGATWGYPGGWVKSGATVTVNGPVGDPGLGVKKGKLHLGGSVTLLRELGCTGQYANPCPANHTFSFAVGAESLDEGEKNLEFSAEDILGKPSNTYAWPMKVDRNPPEIELKGQLAEATDETGKEEEDTVDKALSLAVYKLEIVTTDGKDPAKGAVTPAEKRSGVKKIEVFLNQRTTPEASWTAASCPAGNCPMSKEFTLKLNELEAGEEHELRVRATDFAGNAPRERVIEFEYIPATGMKEEYVMQYFPLPDGSGDEEEEEHPRRPELAVNLVNGNLVYRQKDVEVETASADLEVELFYNSLLPESQNTEWGDGWTMAGEPALEIEDPGAPGGPTEATIVEDSGAVESSVDLPAAVGESSFDKRIQATVTKEADGGYEVTDESGETGDSLEFSPSGRLEEVENGTSATVDYAYEEGDLAEIAIEDPGTASVPPGSLDEDGVYPDLAIGHSANFGATGTADGQMKSPADVAADQAGNLYVLDRGNNRVQKLGPDGQFLAKFGEGQLTSPTALALDAAGNLWIAQNHRVQKFSPGGQSLLSFGSAGIGTGQFYFPTGIAIAGDGSVWVADAGSGAIQRFTSSGQFIERVGTSGTGALVEPQSLDADPSGGVWVADSSKDRLLLFDKDGDFVRSVGSSGTGPGQFSEPTEVDVDSAGLLWVGDSATDRVQLFNAAGDYVAQFGSQGSGAQQFKLDSWTGISADGRGRVWISDQGNDRVARWLASPVTGFFHSANFGVTGTGDGQMKAPADVATDAAGNLFVLDRGNSRIQKLGPDGQFLAKFGTSGSGDGQLNSPSALTIDGAGDLLVAENGRVQKLSPTGQHLAKFGSFGTANGQFAFAFDIAVGEDGTLWVGDSEKVQRFTPGGQFIERVGGTGFEPLSLDTGPGGEVYVAEAVKDRIAVYTKDGDFIRAFGSSGTGPGQFSRPAEVDVDDEGNVWVADSDADRVQLFNAAGDYVAQFGSLGAGDQQFKFDLWSGLYADNGRVWIADPGNNRIAEWAGGNYQPSSAPIPTEDDPQLEVDVSEGLVDTVEGEEVGTVDYDHSGDLLTSVEGPETDAGFEYDDKERLKKVTLANGTYAEIAYEPTYNRVLSVTVAPQGANAKTTYFSYSDDPRRTTVTPPDAPITTYDFAADGSVFKWWSSAQPPVFDSIAGSLYDPANRETSQPIPVGAHTLNIQAHSDEGIASIQIVANNSQLVDEKTCAYEPSVPNSCATVTSEWVTETGNWPPGILYLEVIITDRVGKAASRRFWVNIPYTPPPNPEAEEAPRFGDILRFREEYGLDLDLKGDELAINDRVFDLIGAWHNPTAPAGEVARATRQKWGVPLRASDASELESRERSLASNRSIISAWGENQGTATFAGFFMDHRAGGRIRVGFTADQATQVAALKQVSGLVEADRITPFISQPTRALSSLQKLSAAVSQAISEDPAVSELITRSAVDVPGNAMIVRATDPSVVAPYLEKKLPSGSAVAVASDPAQPIRRSEANPRVRALDSRLYAGDLVTPGCTLAFGAWERRLSAAGKRPLLVNFALSAGHCWFNNVKVSREGIGKEPDGSVNRQKEGPSFGIVRRNSADIRVNNYETDAAAIWLNHKTEVPRWIYWSPGYQSMINGAEPWTPGMTVCMSGSSSGSKCGPTGDEPFETRYRGSAVPTWQIELKRNSEGGDSGSPLWNPITGAAIGILTGGPPGKTWFTPILPMEGAAFPQVPAGAAPGALDARDMGPRLNIVDCCN